MHRSSMALAFDRPLRYCAGFTIGGPGGEARCYPANGVYWLAARAFARAWVASVL